jgi:hypothetical protein
MSVFAFVNSTALSYGTTTAISFWAVVTVCLIWVFGTIASPTTLGRCSGGLTTLGRAVGLPLTVFGGIAGRRLGNSEFAAPCRTKLAPR